MAKERDSPIVERGSGMRGRRIVIRRGIPMITASLAPDRAEREYSDGELQHQEDFRQARVPGCHEAHAHSEGFSCRIEPTES